jgi:hypothetical protein
VELRVPSTDGSPSAPAKQDASCWYARPCTVQSYNALKVRFSATLGEEPEVELGLN